MEKKKRMKKLFRSTVRCWRESDTDPWDRKAWWCLNRYLHEVFFFFTEVKNINIKWSMTINCSVQFMGKPEHNKKKIPLICAPAFGVGETVYYNTVPVCAGP